MLITETTEIGAASRYHNDHIAWRCSAVCLIGETRGPHRAAARWLADRELYDCCRL